MKTFMGWLAMVMLSIFAVQGTHVWAQPVTLTAEVNDNQDNNDQRMLDMTPNNYQRTAVDDNDTDWGWIGLLGLLGLLGRRRKDDNNR
ncbi:MYXO-CTERM domain-containing protein [Melghirimyces profundicolus]|uniref:MYXO-CTERM domain-containing protein n=1 Tax=Melghirimyces profundicolus TaxID=1242148 RepID=A0A2T6C7Y7_9BACL|nr:WGxxGxxG family protein [Melghirimyces profundicolus]PTX64386.1 MYXO-CTERM domain-containing protein [Melghirimyces profundicolus]